MTEPTKWILVKVADDLYKIFASWTEKWRINSGIIAFEEHKDYYLFEGYSGSIYKCYKNSYGTTIYGEGVLNHISKVVEDGLVNFEIIEESNLENSLKEIK
jgi:hypothetical protein